MQIKFKKYNFHLVGRHFGVFVTSLETITLLKRIKITIITKSILFLVNVENSNKIKVNVENSNERKLLLLQTLLVNKHNT